MYSSLCTCRWKWCTIMYKLVSCQPPLTSTDHHYCSLTLSMVFDETFTVCYWEWCVTANKNKYYCNKVDVIWIRLEILMDFVSLEFGHTYSSNLPISSFLSALQSIALYHSASYRGVTPIEANVLARSSVTLLVLYPCTFCRHDKTNS